MKEVHPRRKFQKSQKTQKTHKDYSSYKCYKCQKLGHIARNCPHIKDQIRKGKNKIHHAHDAEDDEPMRKIAREDDSSEEYVLISALTRTVTHGSDTWLVGDLICFYELYFNYRQVQYRSSNKGIYLAPFDITLLTQS